MLRPYRPYHDHGGLANAHHVLELQDKVLRGAVVGIDLAKPCPAIPERGGRSQGHHGRGRDGRGAACCAPTIILLRAPAIIILIVRSTYERTRAHLLRKR